MTDIDIKWPWGMYGKRVQTSVLIRGLLKPLNFEYYSLVVIGSRNNILGVRTYIGNWIRLG